MKQVFLSVIAFNDIENTLACLNSLERSEIEGIKLTVTVVDNASEKHFSVGKKTFDNFSFKIIRNEVNSGFSGGHNTAIRSVHEENVDYFIVLNNDTVVNKDLIKVLVATIEKNPIAGIVSPKIYFAKGSEFHKDRYSEKETGKVLWYAGGIIDWENVYESHRGVDEVDKGQYKTTEETDFATGCCMIIRKDVLSKIGFFDERYFLYKEDVDFNVRAKRAGYKIFYEPDAVLWHKNAESTGGSGSPMQDYYTTRNRLLFGFTYAPIRTRIALFRESLRLLKSGREWQKRGVKDYYTRKFGKGSWGLEV